MRIPCQLLACFAVLCAVYATTAVNTHGAAQYIRQDGSGFQLLKASNLTSYHFYFQIAPVGEYVSTRYQRRRDGSPYFPTRISSKTEPPVLAIRRVYHEGNLDLPIPEDKPLTIKLAWIPELKLWNAIVVGRSKIPSSAHVEFPDIYTSLVKNIDIEFIKVEDRISWRAQSFVVWGKDPETEKSPSMFKWPSLGACFGRRQCHEI